MFNYLSSYIYTPADEAKADEINKEDELRQYD